MDMDQSDAVSTSNYGVYFCHWYFRTYEDCNKYPTMECRLWPGIITKNQDNTFGKILSARPGKVNNLLQKNHIYVWYEDNIYLDEHRLVGPLQFGTTGRNKLKHPNMIDYKQWK